MWQKLRWKRQTAASFWRCRRSSRTSALLNFKLFETLRISDSKPLIAYRFSNSSFSRILNSSLPASIGEQRADWPDRLCRTLRVFYASASRQSIISSPDWFIQWADVARLALINYAAFRTNDGELLLAIVQSTKETATSFKWPCNWNRFAMQDVFTINLQCICISPTITLKPEVEPFLSLLPSNNVKIKFNFNRTQSFKWPGRDALS